MIEVKLFTSPLKDKKYRAVFYTIFQQIIQIKEDDKTDVREEIIRILSRLPKQIELFLQEKTARQ